jgi:hypothetical protein
MENVVFKIILLAMAFIFLNGCGKPSDKYLNGLNNDKQPSVTDLTSSPKYNFSSFAGTLWKTKEKTALADVTEYTGAHHLYLLAPKHFDPTQPDFTTGNDTKVINAISSGIRVRIGRLLRDNGEGNILWVTGTLEKGTNSPQTVYLDFTLMAENRFIAPGWSSSTNWYVNPDILEAVTNIP